MFLTDFSLNDLEQRAPDGYEPFQLTLRGQVVATLKKRVAVKVKPPDIKTTR